jgi:MYXO-CTERM domain-containing protein
LVPSSLAVALLLAATGTARGNGALPASFGILLPADRPEQIVLATNFGMHITDDGGATWLWTCEQPQTSFGYLYGVGPAPRDRYYGLSPEVGLAFSDDDSCTWQRSGGPLASLVASDFFVDRRNPDRVLAVASTFDPATLEVGPDAVFESNDAGTTFAEAPLYAAAVDANIVSLEIARSNPMVVYVALYTTPNKHPRLLRSEDGGRTWAERDVEPGIGANEFRILAVDPDDPDVLYLRVIAPGMEHVMVTRDAGMTFATPVTVTGPFGGYLTAFLRMASGTVLVGGAVNLMSGGNDGVAYRSTDGGQTFVPWTLTPAPHILGLAERDGVLYLAGKNYSDGWALATSRDEGLTIEPLSKYDDIRGIKPCALSACGDQCSLVASQAVWTNDVCTGALLPPPPGGCHCAAAPPGPGAGAWALLVGLLAVGRRSRRRG